MTHDTREYLKGSLVLLGFTVAGWLYLWGTP